MENKSSSKESPTEKRHWFLSKGFLIPVTVITILGGWVGGVFVVSNLNSRPPIDVDDKKIEALDNKAKAEANKYNTLTAEQKLPENIVNVLTPAELTNVALRFTGNETNFQGITIGYVDAESIIPIRQEVNSYSIKHGEKGFFESLSASLFVKLAYRFYSQTAYDNVKQYNGTYSGDPRGEATWGDQVVKTMTKQEYATAWGAPLDRPLLYLICNDTTLKDPEKPSSAKYEDGEIKIDLNLVPIDASLRYVLQMRTMSDLEEYPVFDSINLKFSIDTSLKIKQVDIDEQYTAKKFSLSTPSHGVLTKKFTYENMDLPKLNEHCNYDV